MDGVSPQPAGERNAGEQAPGQGLAFGLHARREAVEAAGEERSHAAAGCGQGLGDAVEGAEGCVGGG